MVVIVTVSNNVVMWWLSTKKNILKYKTVALSSGLLCIDELTSRLLIVKDYSWNSGRGNSNHWCCCLPATIIGYLWFLVNNYIRDARHSQLAWQWSDRLLTLFGQYCTVTTNAISALTCNDLKEFYRKSITNWDDDFLCLWNCDSKQQHNFDYKFFFC